MRNNPAVLFLVTDCFKTEEMCIKALEVDPTSLYDIPDNLKTEEMCNKAVEVDPFLLQFVPDRFVKREWMWMWYDDSHDDDKLIEWYEGYQKPKAQKGKIKEDLVPIAWHPNCVMGWCISEDVWK